MQVTTAKTFYQTCCPVLSSDWYPHDYGGPAPLPTTRLAGRANAKDAEFLADRGRGLLATWFHSI